MSLAINTNMTALSAHRFMAQNSDAQSKSIERLSSGLRLNSAADNAAGYVISEQMDTQVQSMGQATLNTQSSVNMFKTAGAALDEITTQLNNMRNLTLDAANSNGNADEIAADQAQITMGAGSIDRIANNTQFNGLFMLSANQNINGMTFQIGANAGQQVVFNAGGVNAANMTTVSLGVSAGTAASAATSTGANTLTTLAQTETLTLTNTQGTATQITLASGSQAWQVVQAINGQTTATGVVASMTDANGKVNADSSKNQYLTLTSTATGSAAQVNVVSDTAAGAGTTGIGTSAIATTGADFTAGVLSFTATSTTSDYNNAIQAIDNALKAVNNLQVNLGAFQTNNLQSDLSSLSVSQQNTQASFSSIRDTDMAGEMVNFTKNQILTQAAQAMLTQANQAPQNILQMLKG